MSIEVIEIHRVSGAFVVKCSGRGSGKGVVVVHSMAEALTEVELLLPKLLAVDELKPGPYKTEPPPVGSPRDKEINQGES